VVRESQREKRKEKGSILKAYPASGKTKGAKNGRKKKKKKKRVPYSF